MTTFVVVYLLLSIVAVKTFPMNYSIKVIFLKQNSNDKTGTLYLRVIKNRKQKRKSLGIKLSKGQWSRYFDETKNKFRENNAYPMYLEHNQLIEDEIEKLKSLLQLPDKMNERPSSFIAFWKRQINLVPKHGTRIKQQVVLNKLEKFLSHKKLDDLRFDELTPQMIEDIQFYFKTAKDPRTLSTNSQNQYLKMIKSVLRKAQLKEAYDFTKNPFDTIVYGKVRPKKKVVLEKEELIKLARQKLNNEKLNTSRNIFLFQVFANGMRIGDVIRLRWENIQEGVIRYEMMKNDRELSFPLNINLSKILLKAQNNNKLISEVLGNEEMAIHDKYGFEEFLRTPKTRFVMHEKNRMDRTQDGYFLVKHMLWRIFVQSKVSETMIKFYRKLGLFEGGLKEKAVTTELLIGGKLINHRGFQIPSDNLELVEVIDILDKYISRAEHKLKLLAYKESLKQNSTDFVFDILKPDRFKGLRNWQNITESQYKLIKNKSIVINRQLKTIQKECDLSKKLTTHVARHTFANLLLQMNNVNTSDAMSLLGHSSLTTTDSYFNSGFNVNRYDEINERLSGDIKI